MRETVYHLATTLNAIYDGVIVTDRDGLVTRLNPAAEQLTGWTLKEALGKNLQEIFVIYEEVKQSDFADPLAKALASSIPIHFPPTILLLDKQGESKPIGGTVAPIRRPDGQMLGVVVVFRNISRDRNTQKELERREHLLQSIVDSLPLSLSLKDSEGRFVFVNQDVCRWIGKEREDIIGKRLDNFFDKDDTKKREAQEKEILLSGNKVVYEGDGPPGSPKNSHWLTGSSRIDLDLDTPPLLLTYQLDITDRHQVELALRESNRQFKMFFSQSLDGFFFMSLPRAVRWDDQIDKDAMADHILHHLKLTKANDALLSQYGATSKQLYGKSLAKVFSHDPAYGRQIIRQIFDAGRLRLEIDERRLNNEPLWIEGDFIVMRNPKGLVIGLFGAQRDINERKNSEQLLLASIERFRATFEQASVGIGHLCPECQWIRVNERLCRIVNASADELRKRSLFAMIYEEDRPSAQKMIESLMQRKIESLTLEVRLQQPNNQLVWVTLALSVVHQINQENFRAVAVVQDITERKHSESLLLASEKRFRDVVEAAGEYIWETDVDWQIVFISNQVEKALGYKPGELIGRKITSLMSKDELAKFKDFLMSRENPLEPFNSLELQFIDKNNEPRWQQISGIPISNEKKLIVGYRGANMNIHDRKMAEQEIEYLATRDALTGLPNRLLLNDRLEHAIVSAQRKEEMLGLIFIDLDRFKTINDSLGHHVGDLLLQAVAERLSQCVRKGDALARLGGDEFIVALYDLKTAEDATIVARKMLSSLGRPYQLAGHTLSTGCSIGISIYPSDGADVSTLMRNADTAMYHAKEKGRNNYQFFSPEMNVKAVERLYLENELRLAVQDNQFTLCYQPQINLKTNEVVGAEALLRWSHPQTGKLVSPTQFISVAEDTGLIVPIGEWVLRTACKQAKAWQELGYPGLRITVNVSVGQFRGNASLAETIAQILKETDLPAKYLELEITESLLFNNIDENTRILEKLGKMGVRVSIDDFGTGYSSLSYLKRLPIDTIKIDSSFVQDIVNDENDAAIIGAIIAMAKQLDLRVIAEGVETIDQLEGLRQLKCDEYQGFFYSRPVTADEFARDFLGSINTASVKNEVSTGVNFVTE